MISTGRLVKVMLPWMGEMETETLTVDSPTTVISEGTDKGKETWRSSSASVRFNGWVSIYPGRLLTNSGSAE